MDIPTNTSIQHAVELLAPGGTLITVDELAGGSSAIMLTFDVRTKEGTTRRLVFRQHDMTSFKGSRPHLAAQEFALLETLEQIGLPVPKPLFHYCSGSVQPYLITEWINGSTKVSESERPAALQQMADLLVRVHGLDPLTVSTLNLPRIEDPWTTLPSYLPRTQIYFFQNER